MNLHRIFIVVLLFFTFHVSMSQIITFRVGFNRFSLTSDEIDDNKDKKGTHVAIGYEPHISEKFALHFEVEYCTQQNLVEPVSSSSSAEVEYKTSHIKVPLTTVFYFVPEKLSIEAGPSLNFLVNQEAIGARDDFASGFHLGSTVGINIRLFEVAGLYLYTSARYVTSVSNFFVNENTSSQGFQFSLGFRSGSATY